jgi:hypothetical protein
MPPSAAQAGRAVTVAMVGLLGAACASTSIVGSWVSPEAASNRPKKMLVVGVSDVDTTRRMFEDEFVRQLEAKGVDAIPSYSQLTRTFDPRAPQREIPPFVGTLIEQMAKGGLL